MTRSGHTTALPRLVVQGHGFEASFLRWARLDFSPQRRRFLTEAMILHYALGHKGGGLGTFLPKTGLELGGFKATTLNY